MEECAPGIGELRIIGAVGCGIGLRGHAVDGQRIEVAIGRVVRWREHGMRVVVEGRDLHGRRGASREGGGRLRGRDGREGAEEGDGDQAHGGSVEGEDIADERDWMFRWAEQRRQRGWACAMLPVCPRHLLSRTRDLPAMPQWYA